jgi:hypothetical protein
MINNFKTKYGFLNGITNYTLYANDTLNECILNENNELITSYGTLIPQYEDAEIRRKHLHSLSFYDTGNLKSISLQNKSYIDTSIGILPAEYLNFYDDGKIKRLLPLNGKLSGYWSEEDEFQLAEDIELNLNFGTIKKKLIGIQFYKSGNIKSLTFWPSEKLYIPWKEEIISVKSGISFYETGNIKSLEPKIPFAVKTPIGVLTAYDTTACGINGDINSLCFSEEGEITALSTSSNIVEVIDNHNDAFIFKPQVRASMLSDAALERIPLRIEFFSNRVSFNNNKGFIISECKFNIKKISSTINLGCSDCSTCAGCK